MTKYYCQQCKVFLDPLNTHILGVEEKWNSFSHEIFWVNGNNLYKAIHKVIKIETKENQNVK